MTFVSIPPRRKRTATDRELQKTIATLRSNQRQIQREAMTDDQIRERMCQVIEESVLARGAVVEADFLRANLPAAKIKEFFKPCLALAKERNPQISKAIGAAARTRAMKGL